jgi:hypothetical protein
LTEQANLLIVGPYAATTFAIAAIRSSLKDPVVTLRPGAVNLPLADHDGSVVLRDVSGFTLTDQQRVLRWLSQNRRRARIISTVRHSMMAMLHTGMFLETLYYRLNVVYIDLAADCEHPPRPTCRLAVPGPVSRGESRRIWFRRVPTAPAVARPVLSALRT